MVAADADAAGGAQSPWVEKRAVVAADANTAEGDPFAVGEEAGSGGEWEAAAWESANREVELRRRRQRHDRGEEEVELVTATSIRRTTSGERRG